MRSTTMRLGGVVLAAGLLAGCLGNEKKNEPTGPAWAKDGVEQSQLRADFGLCGGAFDEAGNFTYAEENLGAIDKCMQGKGYARTR